MTDPTMQDLDREEQRLFAYVQRLDLSTEEGRAAQQRAVELGYRLNDTRSLIIQARTMAAAELWEQTMAELDRLVGAASPVTVGALAGTLAGAAAGAVTAGAATRSGAVTGAIAGAAAGAVAGAVASGAVGGVGVDEFAGEALPMTEADLAAGAQQLGCELAALKAVAEVESRGNGFLPDKRPKILFEAHVFSRLTGHRYDGTHPEISSRQWNRALYKGGSAEYPRLAQAIALDRAAALKSASWGRFQIMGFNHASCGFADVEAFVKAMCYSEGEHLRAVVSFIMSDRQMLRALRGKDWTAFALKYNGPEANQNDYPRKLQLAYEKLS